MDILLSPRVHDQAGRDEHPLPFELVRARHVKESCPRICILSRSRGSCGVVRERPGFSHWSATTARSLSAGLEGGVGGKKGELAYLEREGYPQRHSASSRHFLYHNRVKYKWSECKRKYEYRCAIIARMNTCDSIRNYVLKYALKYENIHI